MYTYTSLRSKQFNPHTVTHNRTNTHNMCCHTPLQKAKKEIQRKKQKENASLKCHVSETDPDLLRSSSALTITHDCRKMFHLTQKTIHSTHIFPNTHCHNPNKDDEKERQTDTERQRQTETERKTETVSETDRAKKQTKRKTKTETERQTDKEREKQTDRQRDKGRDRKTYRQGPRLN